MVDITEIENYLISKGFREILDDPNRVMNADEMCFHLCPKNNKVLAPRRARNVYEVEHASSKATVLATRANLVRVYDYY
jgi:hypothetical protein